MAAPETTNAIGAELAGPPPESMAGSVPPASALRSTLVIEPARGWLAPRLGELWDYRELLFFLVWRDIKVRYKQTLLGGTWAVIQPLFTMLTFTIFFGKLAKVPSDGQPYALFSFSALLPWQLFAFALTESSNSLVTNKQLLTKVYFPRLIIPSASVLAGVVDFCIAFVVLLGLMAFYGRAPGIGLLALPLLVLLTLATSLGVGLWLAALNVRYRDVRYTIPFLSQLWMYGSPVAYSSSLVPEKWRVLYGLNPMTGVIDGFRWALLGTPFGSMRLFATSIAAVILLVLSGLYFFRRTEAHFADLV